MILLDTHALIWLVSHPKKLSVKAAAVIEEERKEKGIAISAMTVWEICMLIVHKRLELTMETEAWIAKVVSLPWLSVIPVDATIAEKSVFLPGEFHADPADRMIVATAMVNGLRLITSDQKIRAYRHVGTAW